MKKFYKIYFLLVVCFTFICLFTNKTVLATEDFYPELEDTSSGYSNNAGNGTLTNDKTTVSSTGATDNTNTNKNTNTNTNKNTDTNTNINNANQANTNHPQTGVYTNFMCVGIGATVLAIAIISYIKVKKYNY